MIAWALVPVGTPDADVTVCDLQNFCVAFSTCHNTLSHLTLIGRWCNTAVSVEVPFGQEWAGDVERQDLCSLAVNAHLNCSYSRAPQISLSRSWGVKGFPEAAEARQRLTNILLSHRGWVD